MARSYDPHHPPIEGRTPLAPPWQQQVAREKANHEQQVDSCEVLYSMGYSQASIAKALGVSRKTVQRLLDEGRKRRVLEHVSTLTDRIDRELLIREQLFSRAQEIVNDKKALNKDKIAANEQALALRESIAELEGTKAPDKVTIAVLAEVSDAFVQVVAQALPGQQNLIMQLLLQRLHGTQQGALLMGALAAHAQLYIEAEGNETDPGADPEADDSEPDTLDEPAASNSDRENAEGVTDASSHDA